MRTLLRDTLILTGGATAYSKPVIVTGGERLRLCADLVGAIGGGQPAPVTVQLQEGDGTGDWVELSGAAVTASEPCRSEVWASTGSTTRVVRLKYMAVREPAGAALVSAAVDAMDL